MKVRIISDTFINGKTISASSKTIILDDKTAKELIINSKAVELHEVEAEEDDSKELNKPAEFKEIPLKRKYNKKGGK